MAERRNRLEVLRSRLREQIVDAECLIEALEDYCRENPEDAPCAANDPGWLDRTSRQRDELRGMLRAVEERLTSRKRRREGKLKPVAAAPNTKSSGDADPYLAT